MRSSQEKQGGVTRLKTIYSEIISYRAFRDLGACSPRLAHPSGRRWGYCISGNAPHNGWYDLSSRNPGRWPLVSMVEVFPGKTTARAWRTQLRQARPRLSASGYCCKDCSSRVTSLTHGCAARMGHLRKYSVSARGIVNAFPWPSISIKRIIKAPWQWLTRRNSGKPRADS